MCETYFPVELVVYQFTSQLANNPDTFIEATKKKKKSSLVIKNIFFYFNGFKFWVCFRLKNIQQWTIPFAVCQLYTVQKPVSESPEDKLPQGQRL